MNNLHSNNGRAASSLVHAPKPGPTHPRHRIRYPQMLRGWRFSPHARADIDAGAFDPHEVVATYTSPEIIATAYDRGSGRMRYVRGDLVVIAAPETREIITALLRSYDGWDDQDARRSGVSS